MNMGIIDVQNFLSQIDVDVVDRMSMNLICRRWGFVGSAQDANHVFRYAGRMSDCRQLVDFFSIG
jgi:hypothetical protein